MVTVHNNLDYVGVPVLHLSKEAITKPVVVSLFQKGTNDQFIHQKFDHRSLDMNIKMKEKNLMTDMSVVIQKFHNIYSCPICL